MKSINIDLIKEIDTSNDNEVVKKLAKEILEKINSGDSDDKIRNDLDTELYKIIHTQDNVKEDDNIWSLKK